MKKNKGFWNIYYLLGVLCAVSAISLLTAVTIHMENYDTLYPYSQLLTSLMFLFLGISALKSRQRNRGYTFLVVSALAFIVFVRIV